MLDGLIVTLAQERYKDLLLEAEKERLARGVGRQGGLARILVALGLQ